MKVQQVQIVSFSYDRSKAEIVLKGESQSVTRHVHRESDEKYHYRRKDAAGKEIVHETYSL
jgi:hypothetical protein